jgi:hypothetical protein
MALQSVPFVNIDLEEVFEDCVNGNAILARLDELVGE